MASSILYSFKNTLLCLFIDTTSFTFLRTFYIFYPSLLCRLCIWIVSIITVFGVDHLFEFLTRTNSRFLFRRCIPVDPGPNIAISIHLWRHEAGVQGTPVKPLVKPFLVSSVKPFRQTVPLNQKYFGNGWVWTHDLLHRNPMPQPLDHDAPYKNLLNTMGPHKKIKIIWIRKKCWWRVHIQKRF